MNPGPEPDHVQAERRALQTIQARWTYRLGGPSFSPVECLDGSNPILDTIRELQASPLCMVGAWGRGFEQPAEVLRELEELYERALTPWENLRTVQPPDRFTLVYCGDPAGFVDDLPEIYSRWPYGTFPREVQREARLRFRELVTTSRFSVDAHPNKHELLGLNPIAPPLQFAHVASLAATVCIVEALEKYLEVLEEWARVVRGAAPGLPYTWVLRSDPGRVERVLSEHLSDSREASDDLRLQTLEIRAKTDRAGGWLALADMDDAHQSEIESATTRAAAKAATETMQEVKKSKSEQARDAASKPRAGVTTQDWVQYLAQHPQKRGSMDATMQEFADLNGVSLSTVQRRHREAKKGNLLS